MKIFLESPEFPAGKESFLPLGYNICVREASGPLRIVAAVKPQIFNKIFRKARADPGEKMISYLFGQRTP